MIRLKKGYEVQIDKNFDVFFQHLLDAIINESIKAANEVMLIDEQSNDTTRTAYHSTLLKEIMDNSIFVTHQIFEIATVNESLAKFLTTGFLFNSVVLSLPQSG